jgi:hypothetical protein
VSQIPDDVVWLNDELVAMGKPGGGKTSAMNQLRQLGAKFSPDFDAYASGQTKAPRCVLCQPEPCSCAPIGKGVH